MYDSLKNYHFFKRNAAGDAGDKGNRGGIGKGHIQERKSNKNDIMLMTLCPSCVKQFYDTPGCTVHRADKRQKFKETCMYCNYRNGYDYKISFFGRNSGKAKNREGRS